MPKFKSRVASMNPIDAAPPEPLPLPRRRPGRPRRDPDLTDPNESDVTLSTRIPRATFRVIDELVFDEAARRRFGFKTRSDLIRQVIDAGLMSLVDDAGFDDDVREHHLADLRLHKALEDGKREQSNARAVVSEACRQIDTLLKHDPHVAKIRVQYFVALLKKMQDSPWRDWAARELGIRYRSLFASPAFARLFSSFPDHLFEKAR